VPRLLVLLAAKRTDLNDNYKNKRQQQALLTLLVHCALLCKCKFTAIAFQLSPFTRGTRQLCCRAGDDYSVPGVFCLAAKRTDKNDNKRIQDTAQRESLNSTAVLNISN
jgi:hypothetical protein